MGRKTTLPIGSISNGWEVTARTSYPHTSNQQLQLKCIVCGTSRTAWSANLRQDSVRCKSCVADTATHKDGRLLNGTVCAYYGTHIEFLSIESELPSEVPLFRIISPNVAVALNSKKLTDIPQPDEGYVAHLKVPAKYIGWYCLEDVTLSDSESNEAEALYASLVEAPTTSNFTKHVRGSGQTWYEGDTEYGYIYWKDRTSWPKSPSKPPETLEATNIPAQP